MPSQPAPKPDAFAELAHSIGADEDEARWEERLRKIAAHKPTPEPKEIEDENSESD